MYQMLHMICVGYESFGMPKGKLAVPVKYSAQNRSEVMPTRRTGCI